MIAKLAGLLVAGFLAAGSAQAAQFATPAAMVPIATATEAELIEQVQLFDDRRGFRQERRFRDDREFRGRGRGNGYAYGRGYRGRPNCQIVTRRVYDPRIGRMRIVNQRVCGRY